MNLDKLFDSPELLLETGGLALIGLVIFGAVALFICAVVSIIGSPLSFGMTLVWLIVAFAAPFLGSLLWFIVGRGDAYRRRVAY